MKAAICIVGLIASAEVFGACRPMQIGEAVIEQCDREDWAVIEAPKGFVAPSLGAPVDVPQVNYNAVPAMQDMPARKTGYSYSVGDQTFTNWSDGSRERVVQFGDTTWRTYEE